MTPGEFMYVKQTAGMMSVAQLEWLSARASESPSWTEVGVYCGRSALAVGLDLPPNSLLQLVDVKFDPRFYPNLAWLLRLRPSLRITLQQSTSVEAARHLENTYAGFIDDSHFYECVAASVDAWKGKCQFLCGHDYEDDLNSVHAGVKMAVDERFHIKRPVLSIWQRTGDL